MTITVESNETRKYPTVNSATVCREVPVDQMDSEIYHANSMMKINISDGPDFNRCQIKIKMS